MALAFNGVTKEVTITTDTELNVLDLWSRWVDWWLTSDNSKYGLAMSQVGGNDIDLGAGTSIPIYIFLLDGWKIKPKEADHTLAVTAGILVVDGGGDPFIDTTGAYTVRINYQQPVQAIGVSTGGGGGASVADIMNEGVPASYPVGTVGYQIGQISSAVSGSASIADTADGFVLTTGTETNSYTDTLLNNGTYHTLDDVGNVIDGYYTFNIGVDGIPTSATAIANLQSGNDTMQVFAWNWTTVAWEQVGTLPGTGSASTSEYSWGLLSSHVGTGADSGSVRVRFAILSGGSNPRLDMDYLYVSYAVVSRTAQFTGVAQGGTSMTITFPASASSLDDFYKPALISITAGTGAGQSRRIDSYVGATKVATVATAWITNPDNTSVFSVLPWGSVRVSDIDATPKDEIVDAIWDETMTGHTSAGTTGKELNDAKKKAALAASLSA